MSTAITVETTVNAPIETVWECWTDPRHIPGWAFAADDWGAEALTNEVQEGGSFKTRMFAKDGSFEFDFEGTYTEVKQHKLLAYSMSDGRKVHITFEEVPEGVRITETFDPENENLVEMQKEGWQSFLNNFKKYVETN